MKTLSQDELIELLPATAEQLREGLAAFELSAPILCREPGYLKRLVDEGWLETNVVSIGGKAAYLIGWHITPDNGFWFDLVTTLELTAHYNACIHAVESLARSKGCRYIRWVTLRRGIARWAQAAGYEAEAVILTKVLEPDSRLV